MSVRAYQGLRIIVGTAVLLSWLLRVPHDL